MCTSASLATCCNAPKLHRVLWTCGARIDFFDSVVAAARDIKLDNHFRRLDLDFTNYTATQDPS